MGLRVSTLSRATNALNGIKRTLNRTIFSLFIHLIFVLPHNVGSSQIQSCPPGSHLHNFYGILNCLECPNGTFMPYNHHKLTECKRCEEIKHPTLEILVSQCNKTHDAIIHCVEGYYRDLARNPHETSKCQRCTKCSGYARYTGQPCSTYRDAICCMDENFDVAPNHHGVPLCRERPWFCRQGQYFDTRGFQCLPCPSNTFMPVDFHVRPDCFKCRDYITFEVNSPLHSVIVQPCNSTHDTVLKCLDGFYIKPTMSYRSDAIGCSPCTDCSTTSFQFESRKCDSMKDTVCCPQPNMTVLDTHDGPVCMGPSSSCGKGRCEQHNTRSMSARCVPCLIEEEGENVTDGKLDDHDDISQRQLTPDDHLDCTGNVSNKTCDENEESGFKVASIVLAVFSGVLLIIIIAFVTMYCYKKNGGGYYTVEVSVDV